jgi:hypothetical protein
LWLNITMSNKAGVLWEKRTASPLWLNITMSNKAGVL